MRALMRGVFLAAWSLVILGAVAATASAQVDFSEVVTFGDSLTDNDFLGLVYDNPQSLYGMDAMEAVFSRGAVSGDRLTNVALLGASSRELSLQIAQYQKLRAHRQIATATLVSFEIGSNDLLRNIGPLSQFAPGENHSADRVIKRLIGRIQKSLNKLRKLAPEAMFVVWTIPDLTLTPKLYGQLSEAQQANVRAHTQLANAAIEDYSRFDNVLLFDFRAFVSAVVAEPPFILGVPLLPPPTRSEPLALFADEVHPTAVSNGLIANAIMIGLNSRFDAGLVPFSEEELAAFAGILQPQ